MTPNPAASGFGARLLAAAAMFSVFILAAHPAHALLIAKDGKSSFAIVVPDDAIPAEMSAARELRDYLREISGVSLSILRDSQASGNKRQILVGPSASVRKLLPDQNWDALGTDGIVIKTLPDKLILAGGRPRGSLYAVYSFLEDTVGVKWWTSDESTVPTSSTLDIPQLDVAYAPKLLYREAFNRDPNDHPRFAAHLKNNGHHAQIPEKFGGHYNILGWCHTSYALMPPAKYFASHPEWYSLQGGKRKFEGGQLCWSNPEMCKELARNALALIRKNPSAGIISISQNDWHGACQCEACTAIEKREGSAAGPLIQGVNAVAAEIAKEYPKFFVETLAYQYTRKPPSTIRPASNVLVRLCSIEGDFAQPLSSDSNAGFRNDLQSWKAIAPNLFIWNYVTTFADYLIPHPNLLPMGEDLRFFTQNNVVGVFEQGDYANKLAGDFLPLRAWLAAHLMWDPSRSQAELQKEFLTGYYGAAAPCMAEYLDLVNEPAKSPSFHLGCYNKDTSFLTSETLKRATELFDAAALAVKGNPDLSRRVRRERLALDHVKLLRYDMASCQKSAEEKGEAACQEYNALADDFVATAQKMGVRNYSEGERFAAYIPTLKQRCMRLMPPKLPAVGEPLPAGCVDLQEDRFNLAKPGEWAEVVNDPKASNGKAARMPGNIGEWAVQFHVPKDAKFTGPGPWRCYVVARCDATTTTEGTAFQFGLYDPAANAHVSQDRPSLATAADGKYHAYGIFVDSLKPGHYFWVAPTGHAVYVDRIYLQRAPAKQEKKS